uniref:Fe/B12 periplasmic-binding domain-containing protein n=1 Tax=Timspurckia oligopyrenoides TaxID=708627 RepID=A0A7S0ZGV6_9RHOD|mmetsp:Transcript_473/g.848  ORF Transcript_473/g.848 Transcript_473/m.848 type:complete len:592 (+) Transcript_473:68-1843(+)
MRSIFALGCFVVCMTFVAAVGDGRPQSELCEDPVETCDPTVDYFGSKIVAEYMQELVLEYKNTLVEISIPSVEYNAVVVRCGCSPPNDLAEGTHVIYTPAKPVYMYETPTIAFAALSLGLVDKIAAIQTVKIVTNQDVRDAVAAGTIFEADPNYELFQGDGHGGLINPEIVPVLPSMAFISTFGSGTQSSAEVFESQTESKIEYMPVAETMESTPLGRAEWVKVIGLVLGVTEEANTVFTGIRSRYESTKELVSGSKFRPSVATNGLFGSSWFFSGPSSYIGAYIADAGAVQNIEVDTGNPLTADQALERYESARFWINYPSTSADSVDDVLAEDSSNPKTYESMQSAMCARVSSNARRLNPSGTGSDFFESGIASPDTVLLDLVTVLHPELTTSHSLVYYKEFEASTSLVCPSHLKDLPLEIEDGDSRADIPLAVAGINRFLLEENSLKILESVSAAVSAVSGVDVSSMNLLFREATEMARMTVRVQSTTSAVVGISRSAEMIRAAVESSLKEISSDAAVILDGTIEITPEPETDSGLSGGAIAGIVIGSIVAVTLIALAVFFVLRKKSNSEVTSKSDPAVAPVGEEIEA